MTGTHRLITCNWSIWTIRQHCRQQTYAAVREGRPFSHVRFPTILI